MRAVRIGLLIAAAGTISFGGAAYAQTSEFGKNGYVRSCASCHGTTGKGDGPAAKALKVPPADLTRLAKSNKGVFPILRVYHVIDGRIEVLTHGSRDMPVWGEVYKRELVHRVPAELNMPKEMSEAMIHERILALIEYISTLQEK
jgi:mono/diheme cytochrome c family protein